MNVRRIALAALVAATSVIVVGGHATAAPFTNALVLDGVDDFATVPDSASLDAGHGTGKDLTIEAFVYVPASPPPGEAIVVKKQGAYSLSIRFGAATPKLVFRWWTAPTTSSTAIGSAPMAPGWHHVAAVFDNKVATNGDRASAYVDGAQVANTTGLDLPTGIASSNSPLTIGGSSNGQPLSGGLDEVRLSSTPRYTHSFTVSSAPFLPDSATIALWHFDESTCATTFADASGNANTATGRVGARAGVADAPPAALQFSMADYFVNETVGMATITVLRAGDATRDADVTYATADGTADSSDYTSAAGPLAFPCGITAQTFSVPIANDTAPETEESIDLALSSPTGWAVLGTQSTAALKILASDIQPDALISLSPSSGYVGDQVYNLSGNGQALQAGASANQTATFYVRAQNDGDAPATVAVTGPGAPAGTTVAYVDGAKDVTADMTSSAGYRVRLQPGASRQITMSVTVQPPAASGTFWVFKVGTAINTDAVLRDVVKATVFVP